MDKYTKIAGLLEQRVRHGDYLVRDIPSERELAAELGVSHMTARKAVMALVDKGLLVRRANRRVAVNRHSSVSGKKLQIALMVPLCKSPYVEQSQLWLEEMAGSRGWTLRVIGYGHWHDVVLAEAVEGFDGAFILPLPMPVPEQLLDRFSQAGRPLVSMGEDWSAYGIPTFRLVSPEMVQKLLDHLGNLGHRRVWCLNTQPVGGVVQRRIEQWQLWTAAHRVSGRLVNEPVKPYGSTLSQAYEMIRAVIRREDFDATAIFCATSSAAIGAMRGLHESGLRVGRDVSVCAAEDGADMAPYLIPTLTSLRDPDPKPYLSVCFDWMARGGRDWVGPLLVQPADAPVFVGESTGPVPDSVKGSGA